MSTFPFSICFVLLLWHSVLSTTETLSFQSSDNLKNAIVTDPFFTKLCNEKNARLVFKSPKKRQVIEVDDGQAFSLPVQIRLISKSGISHIVTDSVLRSSSKIFSLEAHAFPSDVITFSNQSRLLLKSTRPLDREKDGEILSVNIRLIMRDCSLSSRRKFVIRVTDVNDNIPQFHNVDFKSGYKTSIREDATTGSVVASVFVTDGDASKNVQ
ncbi:protocadherin 18-like [Corticium candelabrum]|uniref:protocadherin 18-like n=1 Tax=Corticium candelabrum TaxID=121492 RepID=UPI002E25C825|nr:protocadherin 18-like [Corticium candelabrum]